MLIQVRHVTRYRYDRPSRHHVQALRLTPSVFDGQRIVDWKIHAPGIDAAPSFRDGFGNVVHLATISGQHDEITIEATGVVETTDRAGVVSRFAEVAPTRVYLRETPMTAPDDAIRALALAAVGDDPISRLHGLMHAVRAAVHYEIGATTSATTAAEALRIGRGVCQDHAHVFIAAARTLGYPARYISGYFIAGADDAAAEAAHAWAEAHVGSLGWIGFDPANGFCPTDRYVRLSAGLDAAGAAPVRGSRSGGSNEALDVAVEVLQQVGQQQSQQ